MVIYLKGKNLTDHRPRQQPSAQSEKEPSPGEQSRAGSQRKSMEGSSRFFKGDQAPVGWYLSSYWLKEWKELLQQAIMYLIIHNG